MCLIKALFLTRLQFFPEPPEVLHPKSNQRIVLRKPSQTASERTSENVKQLSDIYLLQHDLEME